MNPSITAMTRASAVRKPEILKTFEQKLQTEWIQSPTCSKQYVLTQRLKAWMGMKEPGQKSTNVARLLQAVYSDHRNHLTQPVDSKHIKNHLLVFAILLQGGMGDLVHSFVSARITDDQLQYDISYSGLQDLYGADIKRVQEVFDQDRWMFCPVEVSPGMSKTVYHLDHVVPICYKKKVNGKGGTAQVFQIWIQEDFIPDSLRSTMQNSRVDGTIFGTCYRFALKEYQTREIYNWEVDAFKALRDQEGMVQCISCYSVSDSGKNESSKTLDETFNILLEFGELDLDEFFADSDPPAHPLEIIGFWEELSKVADALQRVHYPVSQNTDGGQQPLHGWHADLKPDNILRVHGEFKLADFGFAKFQKRLEEVPTEYIEGATQTFGAPEIDKARRDRGTRTPVMQSIDMWSLGCVLSVAVTWVVLGLQGIVHYEKLRKKAIAQLRKRKEKDKTVSTPTADDAFHDGQEVLQEVLEWFDYLRHAIRRSDFVSKPILNLISESMLLQNPKTRINAHDLCERLRDIIELADMKYEGQLKSGEVKQITPIILDVLQDDPQASPDQSSTTNKTSSGRASNGSIAPTPPTITVGHGGSQVVSHNISSSQGPKTEKRVGKSERLEKPRLKTGHRAAQHSQAFATISKHSTDGSEFSNPTIPEQPTLVDSPKAVDKATEDVVLAGRDISPLPSIPLAGRDISPLPSILLPGKTPFPIPEMTAHGLGMTHNDKNLSPPAAEHPFNTHKHETTTMDQDQEQSAQPSRKSIVSNEKKAEEAPTIESNKASSKIERPELYPYQDYNFLKLQEWFSHLDLIRVRKELAAKQPKSRRKGWFGNKRPGTKDEYLENYIYERDMVLVFDNGNSMMAHWAVAILTAETIAMKVADLDDDGLDYLFTIGNHQYQKAKGDKAGDTISKSMLATRPVNGRTNMAHTLGIIFDRYMHSGQGKRMTLLIFTDGKWEGTKMNSVEEKIRQFNQHAKRKLEDRWFSIQFISFGQDMEALKRLQYLDDCMEVDYKVKDMIDTEPWSGYVNKMIAGSIAEDAIGEDQNGGPSGLASPTAYELPVGPVSRNNSNLTEGKSKRFSWRRGKDAV